MHITEDYRRLNNELHGLRDDYGASYASRRWHQAVVDLAKNLDTRDVLDYGCGKGNLRKMVPLLDVKNYDPAIPEFSKPPAPADIVVCFDVLEHVELEHIIGVIKDLGRLTKRGLVVSIATRPSLKLLPDGRNTHLIVENYVWWINKLEFSGLKMQQVFNTNDEEIFAVYKNEAQIVPDSKDITL